MSCKGCNKRNFWSLSYATDIANKQYDATGVHYGVYDTKVSGYATYEIDTIPQSIKIEYRTDEIL